MVALLKNAKLVLVLKKFIVSEYYSYRLSLKISASFWTVFAESSAACVCVVERDGCQVVVVSVHYRGRGLLLVFACAEWYVQGMLSCDVALPSAAHLSASSFSHRPQWLGHHRNTMPT